MNPGLFDPPEPKPPKKLIRDPAIAAAVGKCIIARLEPMTRIAKQVHPMQCRYCRFPMDRLMPALLEFNHWAGWDALDRPPGNTDPDWPTLEPQVEAFMRLPYEEQLRLTAKAADYPEGTYEKNTGYEYPVRVPDGSGMTSQKQGEAGENVESFINDQKGPSSGSSDDEPREMGGRAGTGERKRRGIGGPETAEGTQAGGSLDRETQAPRSNEGDLSVPPDRYRDKDGRDLPF